MIKKGPLSNKDKEFIKSNREDGASTLAKPTARGFEMFGRNERGSTVMTQNASELGDEMRSRVTLSTKTKNCITSVRKND